MKEILKKFFKILGVEQEVKLFWRRIRETKMKILYSNDILKEKYIKRNFKKYIGYDIDFTKEPRTFNEKIQFRKLYDNNPLYSICADKYRVREYVKEKIGEEYLIPLLLVTDRLTEEQWEKLPNQFVAKANHNSGPVQIVKDKSKANKKEIIKELNNQLKLDYGILSMEKWYSNIPRKIIIEKLLIDNNREIIQDIKIHCFKVKKSEEIKCFFDLCSREKVDGEVYSTIYDENWDNLKFTNATLDTKDYPKPDNFTEIVEKAKILAKDFDYVRVDLYNIENKIYFGELTFCDCSGFGKFTDEKWDYKFGEYWNQEKLK